MLYYIDIRIQIPGFGSQYSLTMVDSDFAFEPPSDEEYDYEDLNSDEEKDDENSDVEEKGKNHNKKTQSPWDFSSYTESVAEEHARRSTTSIDDKISKFIQQQRNPSDSIPEEEEEMDEDDPTDSEPDRQVSCLIISI